MRNALLVCAAVLALAAAGCKSNEASAPPKASTYDGEGSPKLKFGEAPSSGEGGAPAKGGGPGVMSYVLCPFENVLYLPWKLVGGGVKGAADGIGAGFGKDRMPILGALFTPVNAVAGLVTGMVEGVAMSPGLVGPSDDFGWAMSRPPKHATSIWWYE